MDLDLADRCNADCAAEKVELEFPEFPKSILVQKKTIFFEKK